MKYYVLFLVFWGYGCHEDQDRTMDNLLEGYWYRSSSEYLKETTQDGCPVPDVPIEMQYHPQAIGSHLLITADSISVFNYPNEYLGTFKYKIDGDWLIVEHDINLPRKFRIEKNSDKTLQFAFNEHFNSTCAFASKAEYKPFSPNEKTIRKLMSNPRVEAK